jgi:hypothetical protein
LTWIYRRGPALDALLSRCAGIISSNMLKLELRYLDEANITAAVNRSGCNAPLPILAVVPTSHDNGGSDSAARPKRGHRDISMVRKA